jgi:predicted ester cyclase
LFAIEILCSEMNSIDHKERKLRLAERAPQDTGMRNACLDSSLDFCCNFSRFVSGDLGLPFPHRHFPHRHFEEGKMHTTATTEAKQLVQEYLNEFSGHPKPGELLDRYLKDAGLKQHILLAEAAFPAYELIAHQLIAEDDLVAVRATFRGVHEGEFAGIEPTGKRVSSELMIIYRVSGGFIVEHWLQMDMKDIVEQLSR